jgi:hypothetical protein
MLAAAQQIRDETVTECAAERQDDLSVEKGICGSVRQVNTPEPNLASSSRPVTSRQPGSAMNVSRPQLRNSPCEKCGSPALRLTSAHCCRARWTGKTRQRCCRAFTHEAHRRHRERARELRSGQDCSASAIVLKTEPMISAYALIFSNIASRKTR